MKHIKIIFILTIILTLTACSSQSKIDINGYLKKINENNTEKISIENFLLTSKDGEYIYKNAVNSNILLCLYCNSKGEITQITVTCQKKTAQFDELCINSVSAFTKSEQSKKNFNKAVTTGNDEFSQYKITYIDYSVGKTVIINYSDSKINTNQNPTLKDYIEEEDISRPTLS